MTARHPRGLDPASVDCVVLDFETTGLSRHDEVIEVGAVRVRGGCVLEVFAALCRPARPIAAGATLVHGITSDLVDEAPPFRDVLPGLCDFLAGATVVGHHARFDRGFLARACAREGRPVPGEDLWCTVRLSRRLFPELPRHDLDSLCATHAIRRGAAHRAPDDARATADLLAILLERAAESGMGVAEVAALARPPAGGPLPPPRPWTEEEKAALEAAILTGDRVRLEYVSRRGVRSARDVVPYAVHGPETSPRLVAYDLRAGTTRTFRLDRVVLLRALA